jgi:hypothetical protein
MKHVIFVWVEWPRGEGRDENSKWSRFALELQRKGEPPTGTKKIDENVWLIDRKNGTSFLASIVSIAEASHLKVEVRYFSED